MHPGSKFSVTVLFSSLSLIPYAQFTNAASGFSLLSPTSCILSQTNTYVCSAPLSISKYGTYILQLVDSNGYVLNDNHVLKVEIVPQPVLISAVLPSKTSYNGTSRRFLTVTLATPLTVNVLNSSYCFVGPYKIRSKAVVKSLTQLMCEINGKYYTDPPVCVEISVNDGHDLTSVCTATVSAYRRPIVTSFAPSFISADRSQESSLYIFGTNFPPALSYSCTILKSTTTVDYVSLGTVINSTTLSCPIKVSRFNSTYAGTLQIYSNSVPFH